MERIDRLEQVVHVIAEDQLLLQKQIAELASAVSKGFDQVAEQLAETNRHMRETDRRMRENDAKTHKRFLETDARIDKLVVAIGKFISQKN